MGLFAEGSTYSNIVSCLAGFWMRERPPHLDRLSEHYPPSVDKQLRGKAAFPSLL